MEAVQLGDGWWWLLRWRRLGGDDVECLAEKCFVPSKAGGVELVSVPLAEKW